jgi:hypothetical protein
MFSLCGVSARFEDLTDMKFHTFQASLALDYYGKYKGADLVTDYNEKNVCKRSFV